jgi:class 3 adenylate cyclase
MGSFDLMAGRSSHDASALPAGTVTFVFTDIEGSTALLAELGELYGELLFSHHRLLREVWVAHDGVEVSTEGDAFFVAFASAGQAVAATAAGQVVLSAHGWPHGEPLRVRMGVHTGEPRIREGITGVRMFITPRGLPRPRAVGRCSFRRRRRRSRRALRSPRWAAIA